MLVKFIARHYDILNCLNFDRDDTKKPHDYDYQGKNAKRRYKYIATAMEACIAAVYIENGENEIIDIVKQWIEWIDKVTNSSDT